MFEMRRNSPVFLLEQIPSPTAITQKAGPDEQENRHILLACERVRIPFLNKSLTIIIPPGYPLIIERRKTMPASGGSLKAAENKRDKKPAFPCAKPVVKKHTQKKGEE